MTSVDISELANCRCLAARRVSRAITRIYDARLRGQGHGLKATQYTVLAVLALRGPMAMGKLADALGLERTTLTRSASVLESKGWLAADNSADARERPLRITAAGRAIVESAFPAWKAAQDYVGSKLAT